MKKWNTANGIIEYDIVEANRKSIQIRLLAPYQIQIRMPKSRRYQISLEEVFEKYENWILKQSRKQEEQSDPDVFYYMGKPRFRQYIPTKLGEPEWCEITTDDFIVHSKQQENEGHRNIVIENFLKEVARPYFESRIAFYEPVLGVKVEHLSIRNQKTRWGSCSSKQNINLNYRLMMAPEDVIDYVIVHELSHLLHMNHGSEFWKCVEQVLPDYKECRKWLRDNSMKLQI